MQRHKLKIGIVGCGAISQIAHIPAALRAKNIQLKAVCDRDQVLLKRVARKAGVDLCYVDYQEMLSSKEIEAVVVAVPDPLHVPLATEALHAGKHVLVEKPLGSTSAECRELIRIVESSGLKLQVGCMKRHDPGVQFARQHIHERIGRILSFSGVYQDSVFRQAMQETCLDPLIPGNDGASGQSWKSDRRRYNLYTQGAHLFDLIRFLIGPVSAVTALKAEYSSNYTWHGLLEGPQGSIGHFELTCKTCGDWCERYKVCGDSGNVELDIGLWFFHRPAQARAFDGTRQLWCQPLGAHSNAFANQMDAFAKSIFQDSPTSPDVRDGLAAVELLEAVEESLRTCRRIEIHSSEEV